MRLIRLPVEETFDVAVIGRDQALRTRSRNRLDDPPEAGVDGLHGTDGRVEYAGVANHVAVGVVADDGVVAVPVDGVHQPVGDLDGAHGGREVVGRDLGRGHQDSILADERRFASTGKEVRHVGVLLRFGDAQLGLVGGFQALAERGVQMFGGKAGVAAMSSA